jgi:hypothetical protein
MVAAQFVVAVGQEHLRGHLRDPLQELDEIQRGFVGPVMGGNCIQSGDNKCHRFLFRLPST